MPVLLTYPPELSDKTWQKKKGVIGKTKKTGVGENLVAMEKVFTQKLFQQALDPAGAVARLTDPIAAIKADAMIAKTLDDGIKKIETIAKDGEKRIFLARNTFASDKAVAAYLDQMGKALAKFRKDLATLPPRAKRDVVATVRDNIKPTIGGKLSADNVGAKTEQARLQALADVRTILASNSIDTISTLWKSKGAPRVLTSSIKMWDQYYVAICPQLTAQLVKGKAADTYDVLPWMHLAGNEDNGDVTKEARRLAGGSSEQAALQQFATEFTKSLNTYKTFTDALIRFEQALAPFR